MKITKAEVEAKDAAIRQLNDIKNEMMSTINGLRSELARSKEETAKATQERDNERGSRSYTEKRAADAEAELEQLHALMDVFPGCLARESNEKETYQRMKYTAMTRLASWLANRGTLAVSVKQAE